MNLTSILASHLAETGDARQPTVDALGRLPTSETAFDADQVVQIGGASQQRIAVVQRGMVARTVVHEKRRIITSIYTPGQLFHTDALLDHDAGAGALVSKGPSRIEYLQDPALSQVLNLHPQLERCLLAATVAESLILRAWLAASSAMRAPVRLSHLMCEMQQRANYAALGARPRPIPMPLQQREIAEMLGYTPIHISRAAKELRERGLLVWTRDRVDIPDWAGLVRMARFDARYLRPAFPTARDRSDKWMVAAE